MLKNSFAPSDFTCSLVQSDVQCSPPESTHRSSKLFGDIAGHLQYFERRRGSALREQWEFLLHIHAFRALALRARATHVVAGSMEIGIIKACRTSEDGENWNADAEGFID